MVEVEDHLTLQHCHKCDDEFVLVGNDNPMFDDARMLEFPDTCDESL